jgi:hypothetical protein
MNKPSRKIGWRYRNSSDNVESWPDQYESDRVRDQVTLRMTASLSWYPVPSGTHGHNLVFRKVYGLCCCRAPSLTTGRVCHVAEVLVSVKVSQYLQFHTYIIAIYIRCG